jgi:ATP-binding cassette subfamily B protein
VSFSYDGIRQVLSGIDLELRPGEMIGLVGPSGAGKSTLIQLLIRFYDPTAGRILVDGIDLRELEIGSYRRQVGMVLQDPYLFHGSLLDNIRYGMEDAEPARVIEAARAAHAHEFICKFPQAYETVIGERGQTLSGGERQRISIARAILHNPRILILDEATSNVDTETERKIQEALDQLVRGRTVIAIAHRLSTLRRADRLVVLKDGKIVETGNHEELLRLENGVFRGLYEMQQELHRSFVV